MKQKFKKIKRPHIFVPMCADFIHHGHINILKNAKRYGSVIIGLMTDKAILSYKKKKPLIKYKNRYTILKNLKNVDHIIPTKNLNFYKIAEKYRFEYYMHGSDWKRGVQSKHRKKLINKIKEWNGKLIEIKYTKGVSSKKIKKYYNLDV
ncbi:MAG: hypothetical protein CBD76_03145 [Pelagibacteraceae bacterium TMED216]|nr:MAG: hypothetical protein CBD76_03145 [Pelagibacteraceae bacterium TMED216]|tara:strand:- start:1119 stop:1565 length:447 start_codon:yes stop_codon:yes gene_type:complete